MNSRTIVCSVCLRPGPLGPGPGGRPDASCSHCHSLERHRALAALLPGLVDAVAKGALLDVAPSRLLSRQLRDLAADAGQVYVGMDFDPGADNRVVTVQASLTEAPVPTDSVGLMICYHVLEHIPDDAAAMREIHRVLAPGGVAVVQVPWRPDQPTDEDPSADTEERLRRFGQADHVRWYGADLEDRMRDAGLGVTRLRTGDLFEEWTAHLLGVSPEEPIWLCTSGEPRAADALQAAAATAAHSAVETTLERSASGHAEAQQQLDEARLRVQRLRRRLTDARSAREEAEAREQALRRRPDVRLTSGVGRRARRLLRRGG